MSSDIPVSMATTQPTGDSGLMDLLGMDIGQPPPVTTIPQKPVGDGLLDLLSEPPPQQQQQQPVIAQKCNSTCLCLFVCVV